MPRLPSRIVNMPRAGGRLAGPDVDLLADAMLAEREARLANQEFRAEAEAANPPHRGWLHRLLTWLRRAATRRR